MCYNKDFHSCVKPCKFFGTNVHDKNSCFYFYKNITEAKEEYKLIIEHINDFEKYVIILKKKAKSLLSFLSNKLKKIDKKLENLNKSKKKFENKMNDSSEDYSSLSEKLTDISKKIYDLTMEKTEVETLLKSIKVISDLNKIEFKNNRTRKSNNNLRNRTNSSYRTRSRSSSRSRSRSSLSNY